MSDQKERDIWQFSSVGCSCVSPRRCVAQTKAGLGAPWPSYRSPIHGAEKTEFLQTFSGSPRQPGPATPLPLHLLILHPWRHRRLSLVCLSDTRTQRQWKYFKKSWKSRNERCCHCPATGLLVHAEGRRGSRGHALPLYRPLPPFSLAPNV